MAGALILLGAFVVVLLFVTSGISFRSQRRRFGPLAQDLSYEPPVASWNLDTRAARSQRVVDSRVRSLVLGVALSIGSVACFVGGVVVGGATLGVVALTSLLAAGQGYWLKRHPERWRLDS